MYLSGYGVELAIKSTEYRAVDESQAGGTFFFPVWYNWKILGQNMCQIFEAGNVCIAPLKIMENTLLGQQFILYLFSRHTHTSLVLLWGEMAKVVMALRISIVMYCW